MCKHLTNVDIGCTRRETQLQIKVKYFTKQDYVVN